MAEFYDTILLKYPDFIVEKILSSPSGSEDLKVYKILLYVRHFYAEDISVKVFNNSLIIHAKHRDHLDLHGFVTREFKRKYIIPDDYEPKSVSSVFLPGGILKIIAYKKDHWSQFMLKDHEFLEYINLQPYRFRDFRFEVEKNNISFSARVRGDEMYDVKDFGIKHNYYLPLNVDSDSVSARLLPSEVLEIRGQYLTRELATSRATEMQI